jgi:hypothetical protein
VQKHKVKLFYRHGCHLCEDMLQHLHELQRTEQFQIETVDVDSNSQLQERYGTLVPVLEADGKELCHYFLDEVALRGYLSSQVSEVS